MNTKRVLTIIVLVALTLGGTALAAWSTFSNPSAAVVVEWTTASEVNTVGFNLLRADDPQGDFTRVNETLIPAAGEALTGTSYSYRDQDLEAGRVYYYLLEDVDSGGAATTHGPIEIEASSSRWPWLLLSGTMLLTAGLGLRIVFTRQGELPDERL